MGLGEGGGKGDGGQRKEADAGGRKGGGGTLQGKDEGV